MGRPEEIVCLVLAPLPQFMPDPQSRCFQYGVCSTAGTDCVYIAKATNLHNTPLEQGLDRSVPEGQHQARRGDFDLGDHADIR